MEIRAVVGHELLHIRAGHTINGAILDILFSMMVKVFATNQYPTTIAIDGFSKKIMSNLDEMQSAIFPQSGSRTMNLKPKSITAFSDMMSSLSTSMLAMPETDRIRLLSEFMVLSVNILKTMSVPAEYIQYFEQLAATLPTAGTILVNQAQLINHINILASTISRAQELSGDRGGAMVAKNYSVARAMATLMGVEIPNSKKVIKKTLDNSKVDIIETLISQTQEFFDRVPVEERGYYDSGDHPLLGLRIFDTMHRQKIPDIFFANPFMRLLVLDVALASYREDLSNYLLANKVKPIFKEKLNDQLREMDQLQSNLDNAIANQIINTELDLEPGKTNPRFSNFVQFFLVNKELLFESISTLKNAEKKLESNDQLLSQPTIEASPKLKAKQYLLSKYGKVLMERIESKFTEILQNSNLNAQKKQDVELRISQLEITAMNPVTNEEIQLQKELREAVTRLPENRSKGSRIPIQCLEALK